MYTIVLIGINN